MPIKARGVDVEKMGEYLPELINFDEKDWYLLMLVQIISMQDQGVNQTYWGCCVGDRVYALINYVEKLADENEESSL